MVMSTRQENLPTIPTATITPYTVERLLGAQVHEDMGWKEHILDNDESLLKCLNTRVGAIKKISYTAFFKTGKMITNCIFISNF